MELERRLGRVLLPIDARAQEASKIVSCHAACLDIARRAAEEIYDENACASLEDPVSLLPTLDALGKIKRQQREKDALDVVAADFLEALGLQVIALLTAEPTAALRSAAGHTLTKPKAAVVRPARKIS